MKDPAELKDYDTVKVHGKQLRYAMCPAFRARIYIAGLKSVIEDFCMSYVMEVGLCVNVQETNFIYTGGCESGCVIELINYARFPSTKNAITERALTLAHKLMQRCSQSSCTVLTDDNSFFLTVREQ